MVLSIGVPLSDVEPVLAGIESIAVKHGLASAVVGRIGVGHLLTALWPLRDEPVVAENFLAAVAALRAGLQGGGSMTILRCPPELQGQINAWGPTPTNVEAMRATKAALDPHDILNRGRFLL
jgi:FAD/FMN-containing dehydrogenase